MACRLPGGEDLAAFWRQLHAGESAVIERSPDAGGRHDELLRGGVVQHDSLRFFGFIPGIDQFDAEFFRIAPLEAEMLDPQQRLLLETSWHALEDAGIDPEGLSESRTGVYAGISSNDYGDLARHVSGGARSLYLATGNAYSTASGRVSFLLGLKGPAIATDTACSSSLVALHQAVTGLQSGETDMALVGGVAALLAPATSESFAAAGMLSPTGRCWTFDEAADGFVRAEGCGVVVLKRLAEAEAAGDRIWAVVRGSAVNQDGASGGLTVPSGEAQERVIEEALDRAGLDPAEIDYLEAHGTATRVGDPTELGAAGAVYGKGRHPDQPLLIGSVKTNIGHMSAGAGMAGLIKTVLALHQGVIPRHLNFSNPTSRIDWAQLPIRVTSTMTDWPGAGDRPPRAGINSFGFSGTNAHVVVEGYDAPNGADARPGGRPWPAGSSQPVATSLPEPLADSAPAEPFTERGVRLLPLSGKSGKALRELAERYRAWIDEHAAELASADGSAAALLSDMAWTAGAGRSHFRRREGVAFRDAASLRDGLTALIEDEDERPAPRPAKKVAFVFTGQSSQWLGMGRALYEREPVVRAVLDRCEELFRELRGSSLLNVMFGLEGDLDDPIWAQPAIYSLECALTALWASVGIRPDVTVGHSLGEIAAFQAAGVWSLDDGLRFAAARGALMGSLPGPGAMAAVFASEDQVAEAVAEHNAASPGLGVSIAAYNGAQQVVSGPEPDVMALVERFESQNLWVRVLRKSFAYHSAMVEPVMDDIAAALADVPVQRPSITLVGGMLGRVFDSDDALGGAYWRSQARNPVAFRQCVESLAALGVDTIIEMGPDAVLGPVSTMCWPPDAPSPVVLASMLRPSKDEAAAADGGTFVEGVAGAYKAGLPVRFEGLYAGEQRRRIAVPTYPFQRRRHWVEARRGRRTQAGHPLLGVRHESPRGEIQFEAELSASEPAWLEDHRVYGRLVAPGALYGALAAAASLVEGPGSVAVENMQLHSPLLIPEGDPEASDGEAARKVQLVLDGSARARSRRVEVFSKGDGEDGWTLHAEAQVSSGGAGSIPERVDLEALKARLPVQDPATFYRARAEAGIDFGPRFRTIEALWSDAGEALGEIALQEGVDASGIALHPVLLDGVFQVMGAARNLSGAEEGETYLPFGWDRLWLASQLPERLICHARVREPATQSSGPPEVIVGDVAFYSPEGVEVGGLSGFAVKRATRAALRAAAAGLDDLIYEVVWRDSELAPGIPPADFLGSPEAAATRVDAFANYLSAEGVEPGERAALLEDLERLSRSYALRALERLGWTRATGARVEPDALRNDLAGC